LIKAAQSQTCAIRDSGALWCWGSNDQSQIGIEPAVTPTAPTQVGTETDWLDVEPQALHGCGRRGSGEIWCWGRRQEGQLVLAYDPNPVTTPTSIDPNADWEVLSSGRFHTCGRRAGALFCTGENGDGRLGDGTMMRSYGFLPVQSF
jgi:alpha-tubulin suppressor-like RCC1 family protein